MFRLVKAIDRPSILIADAPLNLGGKPSALSIKEFQEKFGFKYSESVWGEKIILASASSSADSLEARLKERLANPLAGLVVCHINDRVGWGLFTSEPIKEGTIVASYPGIIIHEKDQPYSEYHMNYADCPDGSSCVIDAKKIGGIARFIMHAPTDLSRLLKHEMSMRRDAKYLREKSKLLDDIELDTEKAEAMVIGQYDSMKEIMGKSAAAQHAYLEFRALQFLTPQAEEQMAWANLVLRSAWYGGFKTGTLVKFFQADVDIPAGAQLLFNYGAGSLSCMQKIYPELFTKFGATLPKNQYEIIAILIPTASQKGYVNYLREDFFARDIKSHLSLESSLGVAIPATSIYWIRKQFVLANGLGIQFGAQTLSLFATQLRKILDDKVANLELFYLNPTVHDNPLHPEAYRVNAVITANDAAAYHYLLAIIQPYFEQEAKKEGKQIQTYCCFESKTNEIILVDVNVYVELMKKFIEELSNLLSHLAVVQKPQPQSAVGFFAQPKHKSDVVHMKKFIKITQDGVGRLLKKHPNEEIQGLYTDSIDTCVVIIIAGQNGIILIHDTGHLSVEAILAEFSKIEKIAFWTIAFNRDDKRDAEVERFIGPLEKLIGENRHLKNLDGSMQWFKTTQIAVDFKGRITTDNIAITSLILPSEEHKRHRTNVLNNVFLQAKEEMQPDIQYDGSDFQPVPVLRKNVEEMLALLNKKNPYCMILLKELVVYAGLYEPPIFEKIKLNLLASGDYDTSIRDLFVAAEQEAAVLNKYKTDNCSHALRRAASYGSAEDLAFLIPRVKDIDAVGADSGKTALHQAVMLKKWENVALLLSEGANPELPDLTGKSPREYAKDLGYDLQKDLPGQYKFTSSASDYFAPAGPA